MKNRKCFIGVFAGLLAAGTAVSAFCIQGAGISNEGIRACISEEDGQVRQFSISPGYPGLPYSDTYGDYQWAFLNSGIFKLVPGKKVGVENSFEGWLGGRRPDSRDAGPSEETDGTTLSVAGIDINVTPAWHLYDNKQNKRQAIVALVDTGVDYSHEDLWNSVWVNAGEIPGDGIDNDQNGYIDDIYGWNFYSNNNRVFMGREDNHGTHSAGTIAAARNGRGIVGIGDSGYVKVMIVKALGTMAGIGTPENVAKAIRYAEANGAVICNLSFGTTKYSEELYQTMKNSNMLFVVAAGNGDGEDNGYDIEQQPVYPASFDLDNVISVANLRLDGQLDPGSNYGRVSVDLAAPGNYILSTVSGNGYSYMSGTSMAAPMVSGVAAMMYSYDPSLRADQIKEKILSSVHKLDSLTDKTATGGMLDAAAALSLLQ